MTVCEYWARVFMSVILILFCFSLVLLIVVLLRSIDQTTGLESQFSSILGTKWYLQYAYVVTTYL